MGGGGYLLLVLNPPWSPDHKEPILQRVAKGLLSWDVKATGTDLASAEKTCLSVKVSAGPHNELLIQHSTESLALEVLLNPEVSTFRQCFKNMMMSGTTHKHVIHAGYAFGGSGDWILRDGVFGSHDLASALQDPEVEQVLRKQRFHTLHVHCSPEGTWRQPPVGVSLNPPDIVNQLAGSNHLLSCLDAVLTSPPLTSLLPSSSVVGNIRFRRPTMYVFPGGQGDCALFGVTGFTLLVDGGFARKPCFWEFVRHLDRLDSLLVTRFNQFNSCGLTALAQRKALERVYPQVGHVFCNAVKSPSDEELQKDRDQLVVSVVAQGLEFLQGVREMGLAPQACHQDQHPLTLYHKVGHGTLEMYVLSPGRANDEDSSVCVLLVWRPAKVSESVTRILLPGSATQSVIFDGLKKLGHLALLKSRAVTAETRIGLKRPKVQEKPVRAASVPPRPGVARRATGKVESPSSSPTPPERPKAATRVKASRPTEHMVKKQVEEHKKATSKTAKRDPKKTVIEIIAEQVGKKEDDKLPVKDETNAIENIMDKNNIVEALSQKDPDDMLDKEIANIIADKTLEKTKGDARKTDTIEPADKQKLKDKASAKREVKKVAQPKPVAKSKGAKDVTNKKTVEAKAVARKVLEPTKAKPRPAVTPPTKPLVRDSRSKSPASSTSSSPKHAPSKPTPERPVRSVRGGARTAKQALTALEGAAEPDKALPKAGEKPTAEVKPDKRIELVSQSADESSTSREAIEEKEATEATKEEKPCFEGVGGDESHRETLEADQQGEHPPEAPDKLHVDGDSRPPEEIIPHEDAVGLQVSTTEEKLPEQKPSDDNVVSDDIDHAASPEPTVSASSEGVPSLEDEILEILPKDDTSVPPCTLETDLSRVRALSSGQRTPDSLDTPREVGDGTAPSTEQDILAAMEKHKLVSREQLAEMKRRDSLDSIEGEVLMEQKEVVLPPDEKLLKDKKVAPVPSEQAIQLEAWSGLHQVKEAEPFPELKAPIDSTVDTAKSSNELHEEELPVTPQVAEIQQQPTSVTPLVASDKELSEAQQGSQSQERLLADTQVSLKDDDDQETPKRGERPSVTDHDLREDEGNKKATAKIPLFTGGSQVFHSKRDSVLSDDHDIPTDGFLEETGDALDEKVSHQVIREEKDTTCASKEAKDVQQAAGVSGAEVLPTEDTTRKSSQVLHFARLTPEAKDLIPDDKPATGSHDELTTFLTTAGLKDAHKEHPSLAKLEPEQLTEKEIPGVHGDAELKQQFGEPEVIERKIFAIVQPDDGSFSSESLVEKDFLEHAKGKDEDEEQEADESLGDVCDIPVGIEGFKEGERIPGDIVPMPKEDLPTNEDIQLEPPSIHDTDFQEMTKHLEDEQTEPSKAKDHERKEHDVEPAESEVKQLTEVTNVVTGDIISDSVEHRFTTEDEHQINEPESYPEGTEASPAHSDMVQAKDKQEGPALSTEPGHVDKTGRELADDICFIESAKQDLGAEEALYAASDERKQDLEVASLPREGLSPTAPDSGIYEDTTEYPSKQPEMHSHENDALPEQGATKDGDSSPTPIRPEHKETSGLEAPEVETVEQTAGNSESPDERKLEESYQTESKDIELKQDVVPGTDFGGHEIAQDTKQEPSKTVIPKPSDDKALESDVSQVPSVGFGQQEVREPTEGKKTAADISSPLQVEKTDTYGKEALQQDDVDAGDHTPKASIVVGAVIETEKEPARTPDAEIGSEEEGTCEFSHDRLYPQKDTVSSEVLEPEHGRQEEKPCDFVQEDLKKSLQKDFVDGDFYKPREDMDASDKNIPHAEKSFEDKKEKAINLEETTTAAPTLLKGHLEDSSAVAEVTPPEKTTQKVQPPERSVPKPLISGDEEPSRTEASDSLQLKTAPYVETLSPEEQKPPEIRSKTQPGEIDMSSERHSKPILKAHDKVPENDTTPDQEKRKVGYEQQNEPASEESHSAGVRHPKTSLTEEEGPPDVPVRVTEHSSPTLDKATSILSIKSDEEKVVPRSVEDTTTPRKDSDIPKENDLNLLETAHKTTADLAGSPVTAPSPLEETKGEFARSEQADREDVAVVEAITPSIAASQEAVPPVRKKRELADDENHHFHPDECSEGDPLKETAHLKTSKKPRKDSKPDDETCAVSEKLPEPTPYEEQSQLKIEEQMLSDDSALNLPSASAVTVSEPTEQKKGDYAPLHDDASKGYNELKAADRFQQPEFSQHPSELEEQTATKEKVPREISGEEKPRADQIEMPPRRVDVDALPEDRTTQETPVSVLSDGHYQEPLGKKSDSTRHKINGEPLDTSDFDKRKLSKSADEELSGDIAQQDSQPEITTEELTRLSEHGTVEDDEKFVVSSTPDQSEDVASSQAPPKEYGAFPKEVPLKEIEKDDLRKSEAQGELPQDVCPGKRESHSADERYLDHDKKSSASQHITDKEHHLHAEPRGTFDRFSPAKIENEGMTNGDRGDQKRQQEIIEDLDNTSLSMSDKKAPPTYLASEAKEPSIEEISKELDAQQRDTLPGAAETNVQEKIPMDDEGIVLPKKTREQIPGEPHKEQVSDISVICKEEEDLVDQPVSSTSIPTSKEAVAELISPTLEQSRITDSVEMDTGVSVQKQEQMVDQEPHELRAGTLVDDKKEVEESQEVTELVVSDRESCAPEHDILFPLRATLVGAEKPISVDSLATESLDHSEESRAIPGKFISEAPEQIDDGLLLEDLKSPRAASEGVPEKMGVTTPTDEKVHTKQSLELPLSKPLKHETIEEDVIVAKEGVSTGFDFRSPSEVLKVHVPETEYDSGITEVIAQAARLQDASPNQDDTLLLEYLKQEILDENFVQKEIFASHVETLKYDDVPPADSPKELTDRNLSDTATKDFGEQVQQGPETRKLPTEDHGTAEDIGKVRPEDGKIAHSEVVLSAHRSEDEITRSPSPTVPADLHEDAHKISLSEEHKYVPAEDSSLPDSKHPAAAPISRESPEKDDLIDKLDGVSPSEDSAEPPDNQPRAAVLKGQHSEEAEQRDKKEHSFPRDDPSLATQTTRKTPDDIREDSTLATEPRTLEPEEGEQVVEDKTSLNLSKVPQEDIGSYISGSSKSYETETSALETPTDVADADQVSIAKSSEKLPITGSEDIKHDIPAEKGVHETASKHIEGPAREGEQVIQEDVDERSRDAPKSPPGEKLQNGLDAKSLEHVKHSDEIMPTTHAEKQRIDSVAVLPDAKEDFEKVSVQTPLATSLGKEFEDTVPVILDKSLSEIHQEASSSLVGEEHTDIAEKFQLKASEHEALKDSSSDILSKLTKGISPKGEELLVSSDEQAVKGIPEHKEIYKPSDSINGSQEEVKGTTISRSDISDTGRAQERLMIQRTLDEEIITPAIVSDTKSVKDKLAIQPSQNGSDEALDKTDIKKSECLPGESKLVEAQSLEATDDAHLSSPATSQLSQEPGKTCTILNEAAEADSITQVTDDTKTSRPEMLIGDPSHEIEAALHLEKPRTQDTSKQPEVMEAQDRRELAEKTEDVMDENGSQSKQTTGPIPRVSPVDVYSEKGDDLLQEETETDADVHEKTMPFGISVKGTAADDKYSIQVPDQESEAKTTQSTQPPAKRSETADVQAINQEIIEKPTDALLAPHHDTAEQITAKVVISSSSENELPALPKPMSVPDEDDLTSCGTPEDGKAPQKKTKTDIFSEEDTKSMKEATQGYVPDGQASKIGFISDIVEHGVQEVRDLSRTSIHKDEIHDLDSAKTKDTQGVIRTQGDSVKSSPEETVDETSGKITTETRELSQQDEHQRDTCTSTEDEKESLATDNRRRLEKTPMEVADMTTEDRSELVELSKQREQTLHESEAPLQDQTQVQRNEIDDKHGKDEKVPEQEKHQLKGDLAHVDPPTLLTGRPEAPGTSKEIDVIETEDDQGCQDEMPEGYIRSKEAVAQATFSPTSAEQFLRSGPDEPTSPKSQELLTAKSVSVTSTQIEAPWSDRTEDKTEALKDPSLERTDQPVKDPRASVSLTTDDPALTLSQKRTSLEYESSITSVSDIECGPEGKGLKAHPSDSGSEASKETDVADDEEARSSPDVSLPSSPIEKIPKDDLCPSKEVRTPTESKPSILPQESSKADISSEEEDDPLKEAKNIDLPKVQDAFTEGAPTSFDGVETPKDFPPSDRDIAAQASATAEESLMKHSDRMNTDVEIHRDASHIGKAAKEEASQPDQRLRSATDVTSVADDQIQGQGEASMVPRKSSASFAPAGLEEYEVGSAEHDSPLTKHDEKDAKHQTEITEISSAHEDTNGRGGSFALTHKTDAAAQGEPSGLQSHLESPSKVIRDAVTQKPTEEPYAQELEPCKGEDFAASKQTESPKARLTDPTSVPGQMPDNGTSPPKKKEHGQIGGTDRDTMLPSFQSASAKDTELLDDYTKRMALTRDDRVSVDSIYSLTSEERSYAELEKPDHSDEVAHATHERIGTGSLHDDKDEEANVFDLGSYVGEIVPKDLDHPHSNEMTAEEDRILGLPSSEQKVAVPVELKPSLAEELARTEERVIPKEASSDFVSTTALRTTDKELYSASQLDEAKTHEPESSSELPEQLAKSPTQSEAPQHGIVSGLLAALRTELCVIDSTKLLKEGVLDETEKVVTSELEPTLSDSTKKYLQEKIVEVLKPSDELTPSPCGDFRDQIIGVSEHIPPLEEPLKKTDQLNRGIDEAASRSKDKVGEKPSGVVDILHKTTRKEPDEQLCGAGMVTDITDQVELGGLKKEEAGQIKAIRFQLHDEHSVKSGLKKPLSLIPEDSAASSMTFGTLDDEDKPSTLFEKAVRLEQSHEAAFLEGAATDEEETSLKLSSSDHHDNVPYKAESTEPTTQDVILAEEKELDEEGPTLAAALSSALPTELVCMAQSSTDIQKDISVLSKKLGSMELEPSVCHTPDINEEEEPVAVAVGLASGLPVELVCVMESEEVCSEIKRAGKKAARRASEKFAEFTDSGSIYPEMNAQTSVLEKSQTSQFHELAEGKLQIEGVNQGPLPREIDTGISPLSPLEAKPGEPGEKPGKTEHVDTEPESRKLDDQSPSDAKPLLSPSVGLIAGLAAGLATELVCIPQSIKGICKEPLETERLAAEVMAQEIMESPETKDTDERTIPSETIQDPETRGQQMLSETGHTDGDRQSLRHATMVPGTHRIVTTSTTYRVGHTSEEQPKGPGLEGDADVLDRLLTKSSQQSTVMYVYRTDDSAEEWKQLNAGAAGPFVPADGGPAARLPSSSPVEFPSSGHEELKENAQTSDASIRKEAYEVPVDHEDQEIPISRSDDSGISPENAGSSIQKVAMEEVARITELAASTLSESFNGKITMRASDSSAQRPLELVRPVRPAEREDERNITHVTQVRQVVYHPSSSSDMHFPMGYPAEETCLPPEGSDPQTILQFMAAQTKQAAKEMLEEQPLYEEDEECALEQSSTSDASPLVEEPVFAKTLRPDYPELVELSGENTPSEPPSPRSPLDSRTRRNGESTSSVQRMVAIEESEPPSSPSRTQVHRVIRRVEGPVTEIQETWTLQGDVAGLQVLPEGSSRILGSIQRSETSIEPQAGDTTCSAYDQDIVQQASWKTTVVETRHVTMPEDSANAGPHDDGITAFTGAPEERNGNKGDTPFDVRDWGKPLGLPVLPEPPRSYDTSSSKTSRTKKTQQGDVFYVDLTYVPHHGDPAYCDVEFFNRVRARYYVLSGTSPSQEVLNALLEAKRGWGDPDVPVTVIPTYETDALCYWIALNQKALEEQKIDVAPSASRCTINLQDHESSCAAYRLEF
ncbi:unnamed protein product [Ixodes hexagonus]